MGCISIINNLTDYIHYCLLHNLSMCGVKMFYSN